MCEAAIDGAQFNDAWKVFANTLEGANVRVQIGADVAVTYTHVDARGATGVASSDTGLPPPPHFQLRPGTRYYTIATTAVYTPPVGICLAFDATTYAGYAPHLFALAGEAGRTSRRRSATRPSAGAPRLWVRSRSSQEIRRRRRSSRT